MSQWSWHQVHILEMNKNLLDILVNVMLSKHFSMRTTKRLTYPSYPADILNNESGDTVQDDDYQPHDFDKHLAVLWLKKWRKGNVSYGDGPLWGLQPLCPLYYKAYEAKILATTRLGYDKNI